MQRILLFCTLSLFFSVALLASPAIHDWNDHDVVTDIDLDYFEGEAAGDVVRITWETTAEEDCDGFHLWRRGEEDSAYYPITEFLIAAQGNEEAGAIYQVIDTEVEPGATYVYQLEDIDVYGNSYFHGPVETAMFGFDPEFGCAMSYEGGRDMYLAFVLVVLSIILLQMRRKDPSKK